jgi:hypothetical protein
MFCVGILGPELIMTLAAGQYCSAKTSLDEFRASGFGPKQWTLKHAFLADMGGIILETPDCPPFPISSKQLHYLVTHKRNGNGDNYLPFPDISLADIKDKNKADGLAR